MARSRPFILDKETGEPRNMPPNYGEKPGWKLMVKDLEKGGRKVKLYHSYKKASKKARKLAEQYGERIEVCVVSRAIGFGPPYSKITDLQLLELNENRRYWCPYCRKIRKFHYLPAKETRACEFCHIVMNDFHVVVNNPMLWSNPDRRRSLRYADTV